METLNHIEHKLQRLSISLNPPAPTELALYKHSVLCSKTNQPDKLLARRYFCIQWM